MMKLLKSWLQAGDARMGQHAWYRVARNSALAFSRRDASRKAAAMTYFALFSIFPFVLLLIALLSLFITSKQAQEDVISLLSGLLPAGQVGAQQLIEGVVAARGTAAGFGFVLLLWGTLGWFEIIDRSVNEMWAVERTRAFLKGKLFALGMIFAIALMMLLSWLANITVGILKTLAQGSWQGLLPGWVVWSDLAIGAITLLVMFLLFAALFRFSPMCDLGWRDVWLGALITAVAWSVVRSGFALYVVRFADYSSVYGPIAAVIAFLVWLYVAHTILLFGAGLTYAIRLEAHGIHELRNLPCAQPRKSRPRTRARRKAAAEEDVS